MNIYESIDLIKSFYLGDLKMGNSTNPLKIAYLESETGRRLPPELRIYLNHFAPTKNLQLDTLSNPLELYSADNLSGIVPANQWHGSTQLNENWNQSWFVIADETTDLIIIKLDEQAEFSSVYKVVQQRGQWGCVPIADSIGQFLLCAFAVHHALNVFNVKSVAKNSTGDFDWSDLAASSLYPFMKKHSPKYYALWISDNTTCTA